LGIVGGAHQDGVGHVAHADLAVRDVVDQASPALVGFHANAVEIRGRRIAPNRSRIGVDGEVVDTDVLNSAGHHAIVGRVRARKVSLPIDMPWPVPKWLCATTSSDARWPPLIAIWSSPVLIVLMQ